MSVVAWVAFLVAAGAGASARFLLDEGVRARRPGAFPLGILVVNVTGCLLLGFVAGLGRYHGLATTPRTVVGTGGIGAYTTFSTFSADTVRLVEAGDHRGAVANLVANSILGFAGAAIGLALAIAV